MEVRVRHHPRRLGKSKYGLGRIWKVWWDMLSLATLLKFSESPAHWFAFVAFAPGIGAVVLGLYCLWRYVSGLHVPVTMPGMCLLLVFLSVGLLLQGMLGELLVSRTSRKPAKVLYREE